MSVNLKGIYRDIVNNRNLEDRIPRFLGMAVEEYNTFALVRLALYYYTYYEWCLDEKESLTDSLQEYISSINKLISESLLEPRSIEELDGYIKQIDDIRNSVTERMEMLTLFVDLFEIFEYALNRVEYRFKDMGHMEEDEELAREVLRYIFDSEDNVVTNERIKEIIGQLPVRITKQRYFDYIRDGLHELIGANEDILETYIYIIRSSAMIDISQDTKEVFPLLWEKKERLERIGFRDITKEQYDGAILLVQEAVSFLESEATAYYGLIELINELYTLLLCAPYIGQASTENNDHIGAAIKIIEDINRAFLSDSQEEPSADILSSLATIEGLQEDMEYDLISLEDTLYHIDQHHRALVDSLGKEKQLHSLLISKNLHSSSLFIDLNDKVSDGLIDREGLGIEIDKLTKELEDIFKGSDRMIVRAIMANTMNKLPVFFNTHSEVMDYVIYSLNKCTDLAEKYASIEIIESLME